MKYTKDVEVQGIKGYLFQMMDNDLGSGEVNPDNECFCDNKTADVDGSLKCLGNGLLDLKNCLGKLINISVTVKYGC